MQITLSALQKIFKIQLVGNRGKQFPVVHSGVKRSHAIFVFVLVLVVCILAGKRFPDHRSLIAPGLFLAQI